MLIIERRFKYDRVREIRNYNEIRILIIIRNTDSSIVQKFRDKKTKVDV